MTPKVIVLQDDLTPAESELACAAIVRAGAEALKMSSHEALAPETTSDTFAVVGALAAGGRRIPKPTLGMMRSISPRLPLMLLAREPLVAPTLWLEGGWLVLVSQPTTEGLLASRLRMLRKATPAAAEGDGAANPSARGARHWSAMFSNRQEAGLQPVCVARNHDLTCVVPGSGAALDAERLREIARADERAATTDAALDSVTVVRLSTGRGEWQVRPPAAGGSITLASHKRAPSVRTLSFASSGQPRPAAAAGNEAVPTLHAASGDVLVVLSNSAGGIEANPAWQPALRNGGGAVLELLEREYSTHDLPLSAAIVELL